MAENDSFSSDSDDDDYVPIAEDDASEEITSGEEEETEGNKDEGAEGTKKKRIRGSKRRKGEAATPRKRRGGIKLDGEEENVESEPEEKNETVKKVVEGEESNAQTEKLKSDSLWADFLKDTHTIPKIQPKTESQVSPTSSIKKTTASVTAAPAKVTVTKLFNFAGEEVKVETVVDSTSKEAKQALDESAGSAASPSKTSPLACPKKPGGIGSILGKISGKGQKLSTLEKSKMDWNNYKAEEGIQEELELHNKGKDGYIERQAFLQRADLRAFEIEKNLRMVNRSNPRL